MGEPTPKIELAVGLSGRTFRRWTECSVVRRLDTLADAFSFTHVDKPQATPVSAEVADSINGGDRVQVRVNGAVIVDGWVDRVHLEPDSADGPMVKVSGRSATADLVDCAAIHMSESDALNVKKAVKILQSATTAEEITRAALALQEDRSGEWENVLFHSIAKEICDPFEIDVTMGDDGVGPLQLVEIAKRSAISFRKVSISSGEKAFDFLNRLAVERGLTLVTASRGRLAYTVAGSRKIVGRLEQGKNIGKGGSRTDDVRDRFWTYRIFGQSAGDDAWHGEQARGGDAWAEDLGVKRYRPYVATSQGTASNGDFENEAVFQRNRRAARSRRAVVPVLGWLDPERKVWAPNRLIDVHWPKCRISGEVLIEQVRLGYHVDDGDQQVQLTVVHPGAYDPKQQPKTRANRRTWTDWGAR